MGLCLSGCGMKETIEFFFNVNFLVVNAVGEFAVWFGSVLRLKVIEPQDKKKHVV
jgi:hypothetical protein